MPNWCYTDIVIKGEIEKVRKVYEDLVFLQNLPFSLIENGFSKLWLGNWLAVMGKSYETVSCRGDINDFELHNGELAITLETAWGPCDEVYKMVGEYYGVKVLWYAEEPGCGIYCSNDVNHEHFNIEYILSINDSDSDNDYIASFEDLKKELGERLPKLKPDISKCSKEQDIFELCKAWNKEHEGEEDSIIFLKSIDYVLY